MRVENNIPHDATKIPRVKFDQIYRDKGFLAGPWMQDWEFYGGPYVPVSQRRVWGTLKDGTHVWADAE